MQLIALCVASGGGNYFWRMVRSAVESDPGDYNDMIFCGLLKRHQDELVIIQFLVQSVELFSALSSEGGGDG